MTRIDFDPRLSVETVLTTVRTTFDSRDYHWEQHDGLSTVASEGGRPVANVAVSQRLRVSIRIDVARHRVVLSQETLGAAYTANGSPLFMLKLGRRLSKIGRAVQQDLAAAALR
ncbi:hypothetical protein [Actinoalloteichus hymeniacidonis]|uniref:Uncharacterized protein n=1 Tax=Actinoalloteichus hymeniacidonis TaxID=340345 RepID=A0AAC9HR42_9PSEU|nr:hypothetical protein [Actinoalloteichus hymeniacidonis]AOS64024.1 hypothetical protein TL08_16120 [Actinoalloteichus hymeniacidonis]MBB5907914.1 hypothetical protein [Actinoalloteichus hymeniacidonis]